MATSRVSQKILCNGTQSKIFVSKLSFGNRELNNGLFTTNISTTGPTHSPLHASKSEQSIDISKKNENMRDGQMKENDGASKSLKTITGELGSQVLEKAYRLSNDLVEWANSLGRARDPVANDGHNEKSQRLFRRCKSCDPRHLKSEKAEKIPKQYLNKDCSRPVAPTYLGSSVEGIKPAYRDKVNPDFHSVLSTQSYREYSTLRGAVVLLEETRKTAENLIFNDSVTSPIACLNMNVDFQGTNTNDRINKQNTDFDKTLPIHQKEKEQRKSNLGEKERNLRSKCYPTTRNFSFAFFQPLTSAHFFTTLSPCHTDMESNLPLECPKTLLTSKYLMISQNIKDRKDEYAALATDINSLVVSKTRGLSRKVFQVAVLNYCRDLNKTETINTTILNKIICGAKSFLRPSLSIVKWEGGKTDGSESFISGDILPRFGKKNFISIDSLNGICENDVEKDTEQIAISGTNDGVVTVEGQKVYNTSDETLDKLLRLLKQTKISQNSESPILDQLLSRSSMLRKQTDEKNVLVSTCLPSEELLPQKKNNSVFQMNLGGSSTNKNFKFCKEFFSEDLTGDVEFENLKIKPPVSEKSIYKVLKALKDIVREDTNHVTDLKTHACHTVEKTIKIDKFIDPCLENMARNYINQLPHSESGESFKLAENENGKKFYQVEADEALKRPSAVNLMQFGEHVGKSYPTFFQSVPQKNSELTLQCNSLRLHSFIANYNPNIRRVSNLANSSNENGCSKTLIKSHFNVLPTSENKIMRIVHSSSKVGKQSKMKKPISSHALIDIFNENFNLKSKPYDITNSVNLYDDRFDKFREVVISRDSSTFKSLIAGSCSLKVASKDNLKPEVVQLTGKNRKKSKTSLNLDQVVFKPRSVGKMISSLNSNNAQSISNRNWNLKGEVNPENGHILLKPVQKEDGIARINKLNKLGKKLASSTKHEYRYSWRSNNKSSSDTTTNNKNLIILSMCGQENSKELEPTKSSSHLPVKSNHLKIFMPEKKRSIDSLVGKDHFDGRRQFGIFNSKHDIFKTSRNASKSKSLNNLHMRLSSENNEKNIINNKNIFVPLDRSIVETGRSDSDEKPKTVQEDIKSEENHLSKQDESGNENLALGDKELINSLKLLKTVNKSQILNDNVSKLNTYARKMRHSIKYGSIFPEFDSKSLHKKPFTSPKAMNDSHVANVIEKKIGSNKKSSFRKPQDGLNPLIFPLESKDTEEIVLLSNQVENIRERLISDRSKMSKIYKEQTNLDINLRDREIVQGKEMKFEGSNHFAKLLDKKMSSGNGSDKKPFKKSDRKDEEGKKIDTKKHIEGKSSNSSSSGIKKHKSIETLHRVDVKDPYNVYKNEELNEKSTTSRGLEGSNKISSIELIRSVRGIDKPSKSLSAEFLLGKNESSQKDGIFQRYIGLVDKSKNILNMFNKNNENDKKIANEDINVKDHGKPMEDSSSEISSGKLKSKKLSREQNPIKNAFNTVKTDFSSIMKAKENVGRNKNKFELNSSKIETTEANEKSKSPKTESVGRSDVVGSSIETKRKVVLGFRPTAPKQKDTESLFHSRNLKSFNEKARAGSFIENRTRPMNDEAQKKSNMGEQKRNEIKSDDKPNFPLLRDDTREIMENKNSNGADYYVNSFRKKLGASRKSSLSKNNDESKNEDARTGTTAVHKSDNNQAFQSHSNEYQDIVFDPIKSSNSGNRDNKKLSNFEKEKEIMPVKNKVESDKASSTTFLKSASSLPQKNLLLRGILTKDRMDGEIRGLEARGLDYNKKKYSAEKTDKETQTTPIVEKPRSKIVQRESSNDYLPKSILKPTSKNVKTENKIASPRRNEKGQYRTVFRDALPPKDSTKQKVSTTENTSFKSVENIDRNYSSDSKGKEQNRTAFNPKVEGFKTMKVFAADRRRESEKKEKVEIGKLNQNELYRSPLSLSRLISKGL